MPSQQPEPIAVVGSGCRFPGGSKSPSALWKLLEKPRDVCSEITPDRFSTTGHYHPDGTHHGTTNVRHAYLIQEDIRLFDSAFFNISPNEADSIDPQQRLLLETVYEALEAGGHTVESLRGSDTAVYVGTMGVDYNDTLLRDVGTIPTYFATGTNRAIISNRVSYFFDWHGPSMTIDTACSSSLIAVHQGVQALRTGDARVAVACGTQVILGPEVFIFESKMKMLSPTGRSRMWDADADGYARGEGVAAIVLKRLSDAIADGDHIECLIRETGANQDGYSNGITVPNTEAQAALIRKTYKNAGLDPENNPHDGPQFFEAHGTGTKAGDPKEAAAISKCFGKRADNPLYVGSVKTVIGHTEGAAGLAGVLKASGIIQKGIIPPNLLFNKLNPAIEPLYKGLQVPTSLMPWPTLPEGVPRRVSVNSFGFGGSNAHAIVEEYRPETAPATEEESARAPLTPFVFSAASEGSLLAQVEAYAEYLRGRDDISATDLAWTLQSRRSQHPFKVAFSAASVQELVTKLDAKIADIKRVSGSTIGSRSSIKASPARVLGVFTGQGAQWAAMGAELIQTSEFVQKRIEKLQESLDTLPEADRPAWKIKDEMLAGAETSRLSQAALSQPLCTVLQIVLVDLLKLAGIEFSAVVGHSSGEIGAAYASGFLSDRDAVRVAYYRGVYAKLAGNPDRGQKGLMMAVGTSKEDAEELINLRAFKGRIRIAADNSAASVTLSGDEDALTHAKRVFDEEKKFCRMLKVDTAYHSHHMLPCGDPYIQALRTCGVKVIRDRSTSCSWFSSVVPGKEPVEPSDILQDTYWRDNMVNTVLFADAVRNAIASDPQLAYALEVGPHPALKGPAAQNVADIRPAGIPYSGVLSRGKGDVVAFSEALGFIWTQVGSSGVDFASYEKVASGTSLRPKLVSGLPSYAWNHGRSHWRESRISRKFRSRKVAPHELLGVPSPDSTERDRRWTNVLRISEIPWLEGHQLQSQTVFPAAGYCALALEAAKTLAGESPVQVIELANLLIPRAITFDEDSNAGVEILVTLTSITNKNGNITADFSCYSCPSNAEAEMEMMASGNVKVVLGDPTVDALSSTPLPVSNMAEVDVDRFYASLGKLGYGYADQFRTMASLKRRLNQASVTVDSFNYPDDATTSYMAHPTWLDVSFQASMLAFSAPGDERLWSLHVPTSIRKIRVNPELCATLPSSAVPIPVSSVLADSDTFSASIDIFNEDGTKAMVQVEDLTIKPFAPATEADDRRLFSYTKLDVASPDGASVVGKTRPSEADVELGAACERVSYYYCRKWKAELSDEDWTNGQVHHLALRDFMNHTVDTASAGQHPCIKKEWSSDTEDDIKAVVETYKDVVDIKLIVAVGENIPAAVRGETTILEHMLPDNMLDDFYKKGLGFDQYNQFLAAMMKQMVHRYPHARILEIGAGTGGATKAVLGSIGKKMSSYTYTDISLGFFEKAAELFKAYSGKMIFKTLDVEKNPAQQGYEPHSYDIIIASNVLHATASMQKTLENTRKLLKPGGYLMLLELTDNGPVRFSNIMGGLPGWWLGVDDGRKYAPTITPGEWHAVLRKTGFAGVDAITPEVDTLAWPFSIMAAQAVDDRINFLRKPLMRTTSSNVSVYIDSLVILGNKGLETSRIAEEVTQHLGNFCGQITILDDLPTEAEAATLAPMSTFINLVDLDAPIFKGMTTRKMDGLKRLYQLARHILWITSGAQVDNAYHMASITFSRAMSHEAGHVSMNHLDLAELADSVPKTISEYLLRQSALDDWEVPGKRQQHQDFMWSKEPEAFLEGGQLKIPRLLDNVSQNARLNATRRTITTKVTTTAGVTIAEAVESSSLALVQQLHPAVAEQGQRLVNIEASSLRALHVATDSFLFLGVGQDATSKETLVTLSLSNSGVVVPVATAAADAAVDSEALLANVAGHLVAKTLVETLPFGSSLLVLCSGKDRFITSALTEEAKSKSITITVACDAQAADDFIEPLWIKLDARSPAHVLRKTLANAKPSYFLDLTTGLQSNELSINIAQAMTAGLHTLNQTELAGFTTLLTPSTSRELLAARLEHAVASAQQASANSNTAQDQVIPLSQITASGSSNNITATVDWRGETDITVEVRPLDAQRLFSKDKSYLLFGLTGQIGQSLCEWMVNNGAGCVCLTSRNPKIDDKWLSSFEASGATVKIYAVDVTDKRALEDMVKDVKANCPPIAGIANGAMVLHDCLFDGMSVDIMQKVLGPKIDGSNNLEQIFHKDELDFFVMFSSSACVIGNSGQSNYAAANGYLNSLARQRRRRGLAASTFDIGRVAGIGYVETAGQAVMDQLTRFGLMAISETEFRHMFAETIRAGYPSADDKNGHPEAVVTTGIRTIMDDEEIQGPWFENPRFSHCIIEANAATADEGSSSKKNTLPVTEQLARASSKDQALEILQECFASKLRIVLQLATEAVDPETPLVELGIDSLVAVEVRSWFLKELKVDIPVLKIVGGASINELCQQALKKLPEDLIGSSTGQPAPAAAPAPAVKTSPAPNHQVKSPPSGSAVGSSSASDSGTASGGLTTPNPDDSPVSPLSSVSSSENLQAKAKPARQFLKSEAISFGQSRFWFLRLLLEDQTTSNVAFYYRVDGNIRIGDLERAVRIVTTRHEALRTCFIKDDTEADKAYQKVLHNSVIRLEHKKVSSVDEVISEYHKLQEHVFDLASGALLKLVLLSLSPTTHYFLFNYHHIIMDGVSFQVFLADLEKAYKGQYLGDAPRQFPDYSRAQRQAFENGEMADELSYWRGIFPAGEQPPVLPLLPMARISSRISMKSFGVHQVMARVTPDLMSRIKAVSKAQRSTPFHFYLAAYKTMLFSFTDVQDMTIGIADANRNDSDVHGSIGFFLNLLTLRFRRQAGQRFSEAVAEARGVTYGALGNSRLPFDVLLKELNVARSSTHSPFFQAFFDYRQGAQEEHPWGNTQFKFQEVHPGRTAYDITLDITDAATDSLVIFRTQKGLYDLTAANLLLETYIHLLDVLSSDPSLTLSKTPLFSEKQLEKATKIGRGPDMKSNWPATLPLRIDEIAQKNQNKVALIDGIGSDLTYSAMTQRIEAIAEEMQKNGLGPGSRVLVFQTAASDWVCSMLAIMRIGGIYVPLDLRNPLPRLAAVADDCEPSAVLADHTTFADVNSLSVPEAIKINVTDLPRKPGKAVENVSKADSPAAILYTSGSTGTPKGIMVTHAGLRNEIEGYTKMWKLGAERTLQQSAFTFNHSSDQIYTGLVNGGTVCIVPWDKRGDPLEITKLHVENAITYTKATPSEYMLWMQFGGENLRKASSWRHAFGGGESMTSIVTSEFADLKLPSLHLYNSYGPTEISISSTKMELDYRNQGEMEDGRIPCGFSLPNYFTYVLNDDRKPVPAGMPGELYIGGAGVSLGYLNNPELTNQHFTENPFATEEDVANGWNRLYRTGDIGSLQDDGAMVFHNRIAGDTQVKIRGLRIELSDIESNIVQAAGGALREAVVTLRQSDSEFLVAHVVFAPNHQVADKDSFLQSLLARLPIPQYMIPALAVSLDKLPLTNHSKVDRKAIQEMPLPVREIGNGVTDEDMTETMLLLKTVWQDVLGNKELGVDITPSSNFFLVGGNSLLVIRLQARIRQMFSVTIRIVDLLSSNSLGQMARKIEEGIDVEPLDWEKETTPPTIPGFLQGIPKATPTTKKTLLVTGATGYLGRRVVAKLVSDPTVEKIHCVAIRDKSSETTRKLPDSPKLQLYDGNLSFPLLGLSEQEFRVLATEVNTILHLGGVRSFWDNYHVLQPTNVQSTKELVKLAAINQVPIHYISTFGALSDDANAGPAASAAGNPPAVDGSNGYVASRWASERILERSADALGIPYTIHRFLPTSEQLTPGKILDEFTQFVDLSGVMPEMAGWEGRMDMMPAEQAVDKVYQPLLEQQPKSTFIHHQSPIGVEVAALRAHLEKQRGDKGLDRLPGLRWIGRIKALGFDFFLTTQDVTIGGGNGEDGSAHRSRR
ncbi:putative hybrid NRPS/PKS enzyme [Stachybotrys elegans]|uniref:Hybrid NRPS/PKS enzyme n=1 Tax=Stachybotrys elegans TaxID=80388 RepID=A0A8K0SZ94_9HYPO|nr:putative hybrid NRPS/PKS enzyme [Stachybotrys elegans]